MTKRGNKKVTKLQKPMFPVFFCTATPSLMNTVVSSRSEFVKMCVITSLPLSQAELCLFETHVLKYQPPVPQNVNIWGDKVFTEVTKLKMRQLTQALIQIPIRRGN